MGTSQRNHKHVVQHAHHELIPSSEYIMLLLLVTFGTKSVSRAMASNIQYYVICAHKVT